MTKGHGFRGDGSWSHSWPTWLGGKKAAEGPAKAAADDVPSNVAEGEFFVVMSATSPANRFSVTDNWKGRS